MTFSEFLIHAGLTLAITVSLVGLVRLMVKATLAD